jgi:hypothetical protein
LRYQNFSISLNRSGLSDPFKAKPSKSNIEETRKVYDEISKNSESDTYRRIGEKDNIVTRTIKKFLNPKPLNISFRVKFNLDDDYKLFYLIDRERVHLVIYGLLNSLIPLFFLVISLFIYSEMTGSSNISEEIEDSYLFISGVSIYFLLISIISKLFQSRTIFRIYYNEKLSKFVLIRIKGIIGFKSEEFTSSNVIYRVAVKKPGTDQFLKNINLSMGNVYINNKLRRLDFVQFSSPKAIEKMFGPKISNIIQSEIKISKP